jgi:hypothetical protein
LAKRGSGSELCARTCPQSLLRQRSSLLRTERRHCSGKYLSSQTSARSNLEQLHSLCGLFLHEEILRHDHRRTVVPHVGVCLCVMSRADTGGLGKPPTYTSFTACSRTGGNSSQPPPTKAYKSLRGYVRARFQPQTCLSILDFPRPRCLCWVHISSARWPPAVGRLPLASINRSDAPIPFSRPAEQFPT